MHPVIDRLQTIRRRARWLLCGYGCGWTLAAVLLVMTLAALTDYIMRFQDPGIRWMLTLGCCGVVGWLVQRFLWRPLTTPLSDQNLALRVERYIPALRNQFASAVAFLQESENDPWAGSTALRRQAIALAELDVEQIDLPSLMSPRPTFLALGAAGAMTVLVGLLTAAAPDSAQIAIGRLLAPWNHLAWPRNQHLAFVEPVRRVALGQRFEVELADERGARLPAEVRIHYRYDVDSSTPLERSEAMRQRGSVAFAAVEQVTRPFQYRATGGDDQEMPWLDVEVIEPPSVQQLTVSQTPPAYASWPVVASDGAVRALVGTRVALQGKTSKPVRAATVRIDEGPRKDEQPAVRALPARVAADGLSFELPLASADDESGWIVRRSGHYTIDLEDREGFHGAQEVRYEIRAVDDHPPTVAWEEPAADTFVSTSAVVPLRWLVKDDLAIRTCDLNWSRGDKSDQPESVVPIYVGPERAAPPENQTAAGDNAREGGRGESRVVEHRWNLADLQLKPGVKLTVYGSATDYQPARGQSPARRLTVLSRDELQDRLGERQTAIINELNRMLKLQRDARALVGGAEIQADQVGRLAKSDLDHLQQAEQTQRQIERGLGRQGEGVPRQVENLLNDMKNNQLESSDVESRLRSVLDEATRLSRDVLPETARQLTTAMKEGQNAATKPAEENGQPPKSKPADNPANNPPAAENKSLGENKSPDERGDPLAKARDALDQAGQKQDETVAALEQLLGNLAEWDNYRRFHRDLGQLRREQQEVAKDTAALGQKTLTQDVGDLKQQQAADLKKLATRQAEVARSFDKVQQRMQQMADSLRENDPLAADTLSDALHEAQRQGLGGKMREAGRDIEKNQMGTAATAQQQAGQTLDELLDILSNRRERELGRLVKKLREAEQQLQQLREKQSALRKKLREAGEKKDEAERGRELERLTRQQKQLQEDAQRFARNLKRLQADQASRSTSRAGGKMGQAGQEGEQGSADGAADQADQAQRDLDDAQKQLAQQRQQAEQDLAREQVAKLEDNLRAMQSQQVKLLTETRHYDELAQREPLKRSQLLSVRDLSRAQQSLAGEVEALAKRLAAGGQAYDLALRGAARPMTAAAEALAERNTSAVVQRQQQRALDQFGLILESLKPGEKQKGQAGGGAGQGGGGSPVGGGTNLAELKLVKLLQQSLNQRVRELAEQTADPQKLTSEQQQEYVDLSRQQGELADLLIEMTRAAAVEPPEDDLKKLLDPEEAEDPGRGRRGNPLKELQP